MGRPYSAKTDWRYNWYSLGVGGAWALWYAMTTDDDDTTKQATIRFLAGMGVGGTLAYAQNSLA